MKDSSEGCHVTPQTRVSEPAAGPGFRFSWKWRRRSPIKIMERTHEQATETVYAEEKIAILRRHLLEQVPISELCEKHSLRPTVFYRWQKESSRTGPTASPHAKIAERRSASGTDGHGLAGSGLVVHDRRRINGQLFGLIAAYPGL